MLHFLPFVSPPMLYNDGCRILYVSRCVVPEVAPFVDSISHRFFKQSPRSNRAQLAEITCSDSALCRSRSCTSCCAITQVSKMHPSVHVLSSSSDVSPKYRSSRARLWLLSPSTHSESCRDSYLQIPEQRQQ